MRIERIEVPDIPRNWHWISQLLAPSVQIDPKRGMETVRLKLFNGSMGLASVHVDNGAGLAVIEPGVFDDVFCCWMPYIAGKCKSGPKAWVRMMREAMASFEKSARDVGCLEMRIGGRDWSRVLPDYEPFNDEAMLRKKL